MYLFLTQSLSTFYLLKDLNNIFFKNVLHVFQSFFMCLFVYDPVTIHLSTITFTD